MSRFEAYLGRIWERLSPKAPARVGIHWGVFQRTDEHWDELRELFLEAVARRKSTKINFLPGRRDGAATIEWTRIGRWCPAEIFCSVEAAGC